MQGRRTRALDSRGRPVPGLYLRDGRYIAGFKQDGRWIMRTLEAETLTEARRERDGLVAGFREGRIAAPSAATFEQLFRDWQGARDLAERTRTHERHLFTRHLPRLAARRVQEITASELAHVLRDLRANYSPWTGDAVYRLARGTFAHGVRRGIVTRSPADRVAPSELPKQRNKKAVQVLDPETLARLVGGAVGAVARRVRAGRVRGFAARRASRARVAGRESRGRDDRRLAFDAAGRDGEDAEDRGGGADGAARAAASPPARRVAAPVAAHPPRRPRGGARRRGDRRRSATCVARSTTRRRAQVSPRRRGACRCTRCGTPTARLSRPQGCRRRRSRGSPATQTRGSRCGCTRVTGGVRRRSSRTCSPVRPTPGSAVSQPLSQPCASAGGASRRLARRASLVFMRVCRLVTAAVAWLRFLAVQKVEGSSPFIRSSEKPRSRRGFS